MDFALHLYSKLVQTGGHTISTTVFVNFPVSNLSASTAFYEALGFKKNAVFSNDDASAMVWDETFSIMLLTRDFYQKFIAEKTIADTQKQSGALIAFTLPSPAAVKAFAEKAKASGGSYHSVDMGIPEEQMVGYEVHDLDGWRW